jgi:hypothetical protein
MMIRRQSLRILVRNRYMILLMMMLLQIFQICIGRIKNPYSANTVTSLAIISRTVLIFTHADFVGRKITSQ